jgi:hypothetical protein
MISVSDNTAADALLSIAGRENVEKFAPRNRPFLSTREAFILKAVPNAAPCLTNLPACRFQQSAT